MCQLEFFGANSYLSVYLLLSWRFAMVRFVFAVKVYLHFLTPVINFASLDPNPEIMHEIGIIMLCKFLLSRSVYQSTRQYSISVDAGRIGIQFHADYIIIQTDTKTTLKFPTSLTDVTSND